jgi:hypothetical protein
MLERKYDDDDDDDGAFSQTESEGPPGLDSSSSGDDLQDYQAGSRSFSTLRSNMKTESIKRFPVLQCSDELDGFFAVIW